LRPEEKEGQDMCNTYQDTTTEGVGFT